MRTTIELPDALLKKARRSAAGQGISLREFFTKAVEEKLAPPLRKVRRPPPAVGSTDAPTLRVLTAEQMDEVLFGPGMFPGGENQIRGEPYQARRLTQK